MRKALLSHFVARTAPVESTLSLTIDPDGTISHNFDVRADHIETLTDAALILLRRIRSESHSSRTAVALAEVDHA